MTAPFSKDFLAKYADLAPLGEGGMARVFRARDVALERPVAIKVLKEVGADQAARFRREARTLASLEHPHILRVYDAGSDGAVPYLVCELVEGRSLDALIWDGPPLELAEAVRAILEVGAALQYAHERGVVHRDVKPENVLVTRGGVHKLADFGLARPLTAGHTVTSVDLVMGTPEYIAPEQIEGQGPAPSGDQYALGVMLYLLVTRRLPFAGDTASEQLRRRMVEAPAPPSRHTPVAEKLERVMLTMLARDPRQRFASVEAACDALRAATGLPARKPAPATRPVSRPVTRAVPASKSHRALIGAALVAGFAVAGWWLRARPAPVALPPAPSVMSSAAPAPGYTKTTSILRHPAYRGRELTADEVKELGRLTGMHLGSGAPMYRYWFELADWIEGRRERPPRFGRASKGEIGEIEEPLLMRGVNDALRREPLALTSVAIRVTATNPDDTRTWFLLGRVLSLEDRPEEARRVFAHALSMPFTCGSMEWPPALSAGYVEAMLGAGAEDALFAQVRACGKLARSVWVGIQDAVARDDARCEALLRRGMTLPGQEGPAAISLATMLHHHRGQYAQGRALLNQVLERRPGEEDVRQVLLNYAWERGDEARAQALLPPLANADLQHRHLPALLFAAAGAPAPLAVEQRDDESYVRSAYAARLIEAGQAAAATEAVHEVRERWAFSKEILHRIDVHLHQAGQCPAPRLDALRASLGRGTPRLWAELAGAVLRAPGGPAERLLREVSDAYPPLGQMARALIASRRGAHAQACKEAGALAGLLPPEMVLEVAARAVFAGDAGGAPLARGVRTEHALLRPLVAELGAADLDRAAAAAEQLYLLDPEMPLARAVLLADAQRHGTQRAVARRLRASARSLGVELWQVPELSRLADPAR